MGAIHWTICRGAPMRSEAGELIGYAGTVEDVTERKLTELTLRKTEKLAAMGRLAGTIAHEINNPLEALTNLFYLVRNHSSLDREAREFADIAEQQLARIAAITRQSLSFYRDSATPTTVSLAEILGDVLDVHRDALQTHKIAAERRFETDGMIIAHPGELRQVFANLVGNAIQAMPAGGTLRVHLFAASQKGNSTRGGVRVNVVDTGTGIAPEIARKLFEPFFTTKAEKGTGLGLWVSRGIIEKYDGFVTFRSTRRPRTTCFSIFVPTVVEQVRRLRTKPVPKQLAGAQTS
jgi:signal transduction histidine kinase